QRGSRVLVQQLEVGAIDIALITANVAANGVSLTRTQLLTEELVVAASSQLSPLGDTEVIDLGRLASAPLIFFPESYELRVTTDACFRAAGLSPTPVLEGAEMDAVLRFVERGLGVAVVPAMALRDRPALRSVRLSHPKLT